MVKVYLREGIRRGTIGNETYVYYRGMNIVRQKQITKIDALTDTQLIARGKYCNTLKTYQILKSSLIHCFERTKDNDNDKYRFFSYNCGNTQPITRKFFNERFLPPIGNFVSSHGSLGTIDIGPLSDYLTVKQPNPSPITYTGVIIPKSFFDPFTENPTVAQVSDALKSRYPWINSGDKFRMYGYFYYGYISNSGSDKYVNPIIRSSSINNPHVYRYNSEFTIGNATNTINKFGLCLAPTNDTLSTNVALCFADKVNESFSVSNLHVVNDSEEYVGTGAYGATIIRSSNDLYYCSSCNLYGNHEFNNAINIMNNNEYTKNILLEWKDHYIKRGKIKRKTSNRSQDIREN